MSKNNLDSLAIEFRTFLVTFTDLLTADEVYKVAFILLKDKVDVSVYAPSSTPQICALELFSRLECYGLFSWKNIGGLIDIAKKIKRKDLVDKVREFTKNKGKRYGSRYTKKSSSEERQRLEKTFESMVTEMTVLQQHISMLQKTLQESDDASIVDEGLEIVGHSACIAKRLVLELNQVQEKLTVSRSRSGSSASSSSSNESSRRNSREFNEAVYPLPETSKYTNFPQENTTQVTVPLKQHSSLQQPPTCLTRHKPIAKPRLHKPSSRQPHQPPIQETKEDTSHPANRDNGQPQHLNTLQPFTRPRRKGVLPHSSSTSPALTVTQSTAARMTHLEMMLESDDDDDQTGDSGMGTESGGSTDSGDRNAWKNAIKHPPPVKPKSTKGKGLYTTLRGDTTEQDSLYQQLEDIF